MIGFEAVRFDYLVSPPSALHAPHTHTHKHNFAQLLFGITGLERGSRDEGAAVAHNTFPSEHAIPNLAVIQACILCLHLKEKTFSSFKIP